MALISAAAAAATSQLIVVWPKFAPSSAPKQLAEKGEKFFRARLGHKIMSLWIGPLFFGEGTNFTGATFGETQITSADPDVVKFCVRTDNF